MQATDVQSDIVFASESSSQFNERSSHRLHLETRRTPTTTPSSPG